MEAITYRLLQPDEAGEYRTLRLRCLKENPMAFATSFEEEQANEKLRFHEAIASGDPDDFVMGAFQGPSCVGICGHLREKKGKARHTGRLLQVYVHSEQQGRGVGSKLILATVDHVFNKLGVEMVTLGVVARNEGALSTYTRLGFEQYGLLKKYLYYEGNYYDEVLMAKYK
ncbi:GNAT family N-acetyltransferase [Roseivirga sp. BDSF3-8]|uniref:GNAT family N-acetyltransferase n=1 Tax=Roseivirga sp. BDSF3-8 TaxID=3241598 RepID=UPI003531D0EB